MSEDLIPSFSLDPNPMDVPDPCPLMTEAINATGVSLADITPVQRRILLSIQKDPNYRFLNKKQISEIAGCSYPSMVEAFSNPEFVKLFHYIQNAQLLIHLPEIDEMTIKKAKSERGSHHDRELAYRRLNVISDKKGGLTVQVMQQNNLGNGTTDGRKLCPADDLIDRWSGSPVEGDKFRGKKTIIQTPGKD